MRALILATGFRDESSSLDEDVPVSLMTVGDKPVIDYLLDSLVELPGIEEIQVRTNTLYYPLFREWLRRCDYMGKVEISSNRIDCSEEGRGFFCEIDDVCNAKSGGGEMLVADGDSIFDFSLEDFIGFSNSVAGDIIAVSREKTDAGGSRGGVLVTSNNRVVDFINSSGEEKAGIYYPVGLFILSAESVPFVKRYLMEEGEEEREGDFFSWSYRRRPLFAYQIDGKCYRIHDGKSYFRVCSEFEKSG